MVYVSFTFLRFSRITLEGFWVLGVKGVLELKSVIIHFKITTYIKITFKIDDTQMNLVLKESEDTIVQLFSDPDDQPNSAVLPLPGIQIRDTEWEKTESYQIEEAA